MKDLYVYVTYDEERAEKMTIDFAVFAAEGIGDDIFIVYTKNNYSGPIMDDIVEYIQSRYDGTLNIMMTNQDKYKNTYQIVPSDPKNETPERIDEIRKKFDSITEAVNTLDQFSIVEIM